MSKVCDLTGKRPISGNHVSHSNHKTKRRFYPNLHTKKFYIPETGEWITLKVSAAAIRTISKLGILQYIKKLEKKGEIVFRLSRHSLESLLVIIRSSFIVKKYHGKEKQRQSHPSHSGMYRT